MDFDATRYRQQRLADLRAEQQAKFGEVRQLCRASYVKEVTEATRAIFRRLAEV